MPDRDTLALLIMPGIPEDFRCSGKARVVHRFHSMSFRLSRIVAPLAAMLLAGCGASAAGGSFGNQDDVGTPDDVGTWDTLDPDAPITVPDAAPPITDCPPGKDGKANICIRVTSGSLKTPSIGADVTKDLGIDGSGAMVVGLSTAPPAAGGPTTWEAKALFPSITSGTTFKIDDLPKTSEFLVGPGSYYVWAIFRDREPYERGLAVGDYVPIDVVRIDVQKADATKMKSLWADVKILPLRGVDVTVSLKPGLKPLGNGIGPLRVQLGGTGYYEGKSLAEQIVPCLDLTSSKSATVQLLTAVLDDSGGYYGNGVRAALFDFATGPDDPSLAVMTPPQGSLVNLGAELATFSSGTWYAPPVSVVLDHAIAFTGPPLPDPSLYCASASAAPAK
jgi:hypothetical protein